MDAKPVLMRIAELLDRYKLEAILIGNAAAALQGAPVTTVDLDFLFRRTPANIRKLKAIADDLDAVLMRPYYPVSPLWRISRDSDGLQLDFMNAIDGVRSFEGLRNRSVRAEIGGAGLLVAALADIIRSKKAAGRPQDLAVLPVLEKLLEEIARDPQSETRSPETGK
jgi:hypothetical protein